MSDTAGNAAGAAPAFSTQALEALRSQGASLESFVAEIARNFGVQTTEVAVLRLEHNLLRFLSPEELKTSGTIPLSSSSSVAAHTASSKRIELFNNFTKIRHVRIFETVKLPDAETSERVQQPVIQRLISAPIQSEEGKVRGVIQICRKGMDLAGAGPEFSMEDVHRLEATAKVLANAEFILSA
ncbi:MAG TPA: GAF domain-containing protein [Terriglobales bacterium]|nr:GAF domain-containing protein [Terriglobales bacterium]